MTGATRIQASRHLVDPELIEAIDPYPSVHAPIASLEEVRTELRRMLAAAPVPCDPRVQRLEVQVPAGPGAPNVRLLVYVPRQPCRARPAVLHIHGGGYVVGAPEFAESANTQLAADLGCVVASVDYRLAPEHPYPAALQDCHAALRWLHEQSDALGVDPRRVAVKGESAGGGLAAALALYARDQGGPSLCFQHLTYPMLDDRTGLGPDPHPYAGDFVWTPERNRLGWEALLGQPPGASDVPGWAAPARATDLRGMPPTFICVGALDLFLEENLEFGRRLTRAGVPLELHVYPGAFHGFGAAVQARVSRAAARDSREALRRALSG